MLKGIFWKAAVLLAAGGLAPAAAQERSVAGTGTSWRAAGSAATAPQSAGQGMAAVERAAAAGKYLFIFFYQEQNPQTDAMWKVFEPVMKQMADWADWTAIRVGDPAQKPIVARFDVSCAPMPLVLALAPCGAITKALPVRFDENQLREAFVSPGTEKCLKALQDRKLVDLCVQRQAAAYHQAALQRGVQDFKADPRFARATEVVVLNPEDQTEAKFLRDLQVNPQASAVTLLMAPPGSVVGRFEGTVTKEQLAATLASTQSGACPGGKCGPNGCGPKR